MNNSESTPPLLQSNDLQGTIEARVAAYYTAYYAKTLGIPDATQRVKSRLSEESAHANRIRHALGPLAANSSGKKILIVGGGTGGEALAFHALGFDVHCLEPDQEAFAICSERMKAAGIPEGHAHNVVAEKLPFPDDFFDGIWSFTVLEHVNDVKAALIEIIRTLKPAGWASLHFPDYRSFYEGHYKVTLPLFLPKWINAFILYTYGRNPKFYLLHTNNITHKVFMGHLVTQPVTVYKMRFDHLPRANGLREFLNKFLFKMFGIDVNLSYIVFKQNHLATTGA